MEKNEKELETALKIAIKKAVEHGNAQANFDRLASKFFGIGDFSQVYNNHDRIVDAVVYGNANLTLKQLKKEVDDFKNDKREKS